MKVETLWKYNEEGRYYHDLNHIRNMMRVAKLMKLKLNIAQKLAILYHDVIYRFDRNDNEEMSAKTMYFEEKDNYGARTLDEAYKIILSTKRHEPLCKSANDVIDLDLHGLGDRETYWQTLSLVKKEYMLSGKMTQEEWDKGRLEWLTHMLGKKQIYYGCFKDCDEDARHNLTNEFRTYMPQSRLTFPNADGVVRGEVDLG